MMKRWTAAILLVLVLATATFAAVVPFFLVKSIPYQAIVYAEGKAAGPSPWPARTHVYIYEYIDTGNGYWYPAPLAIWTDYYAFDIPINYQSDVFAIVNDQASPWLGMVHVWNQSEGMWYPRVFQLHPGSVFAFPGPTTDTGLIDYEWSTYRFRLCLELDGYPNNLFIYEYDSQGEGNFYSVTDPGYTYWYWDCEDLCTNHGVVWSPE